MGARGVKDTGGSSWGLTETEAPITEPTWVFTRSSIYVMVISLVFCRDS